MKPRKHQAEFAQVIQEKINGASFQNVLIRATPGSGKSGIPIQATELIRAGLAEGIAWVVPRDALRSQGERTFLDPFFRKLHGTKSTIRAAKNEPDPCRGTQGFITTFQAVGMDATGHIYREFCRRRYVLILDEFHHCELNGLWAEKIQALVDKAAFVVLMTGTLKRGDGKPIAFLPYTQVKRDGMIEYQPHLSAPNMRYIEYTRAMALEEMAIIPMQFTFHDGSAEYEEDGRRTKVDSIAGAAPRQVSAALYTALRTDYANELLAKAVKHWLEWRKKIKTAKLLVVCADYTTAKVAAQYIRKLTSRPSDIATSHESAAAVRAIDRFKAGSVEILVTIAMAYEGLDVPPVSHVACLTHIRSMAWIEQMIARAVRIDRAYHYQGQVAHIYVPDDPLMRKIVEKIENEQLSSVDNYDPGRRESEEMEQLTLFDPDLNSSPKNSQVNPIGSKVTGEREWVYGEPAPVENAKPITAEPQPFTPKEREKALRKQIETHVRQYCRMNRYKQSKINAEIKRHFGKGRAQMNGAELGIVLNFVKRNYPTSYQVRGRHAPVSREVKVESYST